MLVVPFAPIKSATQFAEVPLNEREIRSECVSEYRGSIAATAVAVEIIITKDKIIEIRCLIYIFITYILPFHTASIIKTVQRGENTSNIF